MHFMRLLPALSHVLLALPVFGVSTLAAPGVAQAEVVCSRAGSEFDFDGGYATNLNTTTNMVAKLSNPDYFGPTGTAAPETLSFQTLSVLNATTLAACDIYIGGGFQEGGTPVGGGGATGILATSEANALKTWSDSSDEHFVIGGCDNTGNQTCGIFGRTISAVDNSPLTFTGGTALDYNPITCGGTGGAPVTFGGASGDITELINDARLADHSGADVANNTYPPSVAGMAGVTTNFSGTLGAGGEFQASKYLFTADADITASSGNSAVGAGPIASSDNAIFVVNIFKFALDAIKDRNAQPSCFANYEDDADLAIAMSPSATTVTGGQDVTLTVTVTHQSGDTVGGVEATIPVPSGFTFKSASGTGNYNSGTGVWTIGTINPATSVSIDLVLTAQGPLSTATIPATAEITAADIADRDSQTNASFNEDDRADGIADDDETSLNLTVTPSDRSDAPVAGTAPSGSGVNAYGDAIHTLAAGVLLGTLNDADTGALSNADASGDGAEDDGVTIPPLTLGVAASISVDVAGAGGFLNGWIDWDGNGVFDGGTERLLTDVQDNGVGDTDLTVGRIGFTVTPALSAVTGNTFARFRWSTASGLDSTAIAPNGEVEDYQVTVSNAPVGPPSPDVAFASCEAPNFTGIAPDGLEDLAFPRGYWAASYYEGTVGTAGSTRTTPTNGTGGNGSPIFHGEAFFGTGENPVTINGNGSHDVYKRWTQNENPTAPGLPHPSYTGNSWDNSPSTNRHFTIDHRRTIDVPGVLTFGHDPATEILDDVLEVFINGTRVYAYFPPSMGSAPNTRPGSGGPSGNTGATIPVAANDEVLVRFANYGWIGGYAFHLNVAGYDCSDTPTSGTSYGLASHIEHESSTLRLGATNDDETTNIASANADGDGAEDDGVTLRADMRQGIVSPIFVNVTQASGNEGYLQAWIDWDRDGNFTGPGEQIATDLQSTAAGSSTLRILATVPENATTSQTFARFRWSTVSGLDSTTTASDGEVEDYALTILPEAVPTFTPGCVAQNVTNFGFETHDPADALGFFGTEPTRAFLFNELDIPGWSTDASNNQIEIWESGHIGFYSIEGGAHAEINANEVAALTQDASGLAGDRIEWYVWHRGRDGTDVATFGLGGADGGTQSVVATLSTDNTAWQNYSGSFKLPASELRFELRAVSTASGSASAGNLVDNFHFAVCPVSRDYTDAPPSYGNANHAITAGFFIGSGVTTDADDYGSANANGDVDDGVTIPTLVPGGSGVISVNVNGTNGFLQAWVDWDGSGDFDDPVERIATDLSDPDGDGVIEIPVTVPDYAVTTQTFARFRWSSGFGIASTGAAFDGEVEDYALTMGGGSFLSGRIFFDNGAAGGTAHDAALTGGEVGTDRAGIAIYNNATNVLLTNATVAGDGTWTATVPDGFNGEMRIEAVTQPGLRLISEATGSVGALPGNTDTTDGVLVFSYSSGTTHTGLNFGLIESPRLTQDQTASVSPGQLVDLPHVYVATTSGDVSFALVDQVANPDGGFAAAIFADADCDGTPDSALAASTPVTVGQQICLAVRTQAGSGVGAGSSFSYGIEATTALTLVGISEVARNNDALGSGGGGEDLVLRKLVSNITKGSPEAVSNSGDLGDVLQYRIVLTNPGPGPATNVTVSDQTPAYTSLTSALPTSVVVSTLTCNLIAPTTGNAPGYVGPLEWSCPGAMPSGSEGSLSFQVTISP